MSHTSPSTRSLSPAGRAPLSLYVGACGAVVALVGVVAACLVADATRVPATTTAIEDVYEPPPEVLVASLRSGVATTRPALPDGHPAAFAVASPMPSLPPAAFVPKGPMVPPLRLPTRPRSVMTVAEVEATAEQQAETIDLFDAPGRFWNNDPSRRFSWIRRRVDETRARAMATRDNDARDALTDPIRGPFWVAADIDIEGLPLLEGDDCRLTHEESVRLANVSTQVGRQAANIASSVNRLANVRFASAFEMPSRTEALWRSVDHLVDRGEHDPSGLHQIMQVTPKKSRLNMVEKLSDTAELQATKALVQRVLFDPDAEVRAKATEALALRPMASWRADLFKGFDYPWPPAADHAADAVIALERTDFVDQLTELAGRPDPRAPVRNADGHWHARELTRANHLRNCLLCHAPVTQVNFNASQTPSGVVPDPYAPLPRIYYGGQSNQILVRADVTYLWQDFSLMHTVENPKFGWPNRQRFDYFVRTRDLTEREAAELAERYPPERSEQRQAARYARDVLVRIRDRDRALLTQR